MRIPCAKCGHPHDSTVTPFMHDILKPIMEPQNRTGLSTAVATGTFKCLKCGNDNEVGVMWTVITKEEEEYTSLKELEWAKANKYEKAITNSGKVHYVTTGCWQEGKVEPFCNCRSWLGDYWGKKWKLTYKPVTCGNCLSRMRRMMGES